MWTVNSPQKVVIIVVYQLWFLKKMLLHFAVDYCISTARRYASAVYAVVVCLSDCLSVLSHDVKLLYRNDHTDRPTADFWHGSFFWHIVHCILRKFVYFQKLRVLPSGSLLQTLDLENFATASRWCGRLNSSTVELVDHTYEGRAPRDWIHTVCYSLIDCNPLTPLLRFILDLLQNLFLRCCAAVGKILTGKSRRAVRLT